jgi:hypothetical protein
MKTIKKSGILLAILAALVVLAGCASAGETAEEPLIMESRAQYEVLDHAGAMLGNNTLPSWLTTYLNAGSNSMAVEKLSEYAGYYCFVGEAESPNKLFAQTWAESVDGPALIAGMIALRVEAMTRSSNQGDETAMERFIDQESTVLIKATFDGYRKVADWWVWMRVYDPRNLDLILSENYHAYVLFIIGKKILDEQIAAELARNMEAQDNLSEFERTIYTNMIQRILREGLGVE